MQKRTAFTLAFLLLFLMQAHQACVRVFDVEKAKRDDTQVSTSRANGEGYSGKPDIYEYREPSAPCADQDMAGRPLPNEQVFVFLSGNGQKVRESCADITPQNIEAKDITRLPTGDISVNSRTYVRHNIGDFEIVAATCPPPSTPLASPTRVSLFPAVLDLTVPEWFAHLGIGSTLAGSLASLPLYTITRNNPSYLEDYRRLSTSTNLQAGERYVFSFFVKRTLSGERALYMGSHSNISLMDVEVSFDLDTGAANPMITAGVSNFSTSATPLADGLFISIYFTPQTTEVYNLGIAPQTTVLGANIAATAVSLEAVSSFCTP